MDYDFRNYEGKTPMYRNPSSTSASSPMYSPPPPPSSTSSSSNMYPKINQSGSHTGIAPTARPFPHHPQNPAPPPPSSSSSGLGIRVTIKPEYRITPPPQLSSIGAEIPRSNFQFDFEFEKRVLAEAEKGNPNWAKFGMENAPPRRMPPPPSASVDPTVGKYIASGLNREAASLGVAHYGDNPNKVREFANGYNILREMGFQSKNVAEALVMNDNNTDKALAHILNNSS